MHDVANHCAPSKITDLFIRYDFIHSHYHTCPIHRHNEIVMRFLVRHNRHHKVSQSVPHFMSRKTVTTFLRIKVGGHFVMSIVKCYESHYVGVLDNPPHYTRFSAVGNFHLQGSRTNQHLLSFSRTGTRI